MWIKKDNKYQWVKDYNPVPLKKVCPVCNKEFENIARRGSFRYQKTCSYECANIYKADQSKFLCGYCGKKLPQDNRKKFCSDFCRQRSYLLKQSITRKHGYT